MKRNGKRAALYLAMAVLAALLMGGCKNTVEPAATSLQGEQGPQGEQGEQGPQGEQGEQVLKAKMGKTVKTLI